MLLESLGEVGVAVVGLPHLELALVIFMGRGQMYSAPLCFSPALILLLFRRMIISFCSALIVGMRRGFVQRAPPGRLFFPGLLVVGVVLGAMLLAVSKLPTDVALYTVEVILCLHGDTASCNRWRA